MNESAGVRFSPFTVIADTVRGPTSLHPTNYVITLPMLARVLAHVRPRLALRFSSTLRGDQEHLHDILDQAEDARSTCLSSPYVPLLTSCSPQREHPMANTRSPQKICRRPGMPLVASLHTRLTPIEFIRPHYWTYQHRFQPKNIRTAPPLVAPSRKEACQHDVFRELGIDPLWETSNSTLLASFVTELSKIRPRTHTRLTTKTQRRLGKAIRRAKMMGVIPLFYNPRMIPKPGN